MESDKFREPSEGGLSRRNVLGAAVWAAPAITVAAALPLAAVSVQAQGEWVFDFQQGNFNDGKYDLKARLIRNPQLPNWEQVRNLPHNGYADFTITIFIRNENGFFTYGQDGNGIRLNAQAEQEGWILSGFVNDPGGFDLVRLTNSIGYSNFNDGRAIENVHIEIPTLAKQNGRNVDGREFISVQFSAPTFVTSPIISLAN